MSLSMQFLHVSRQIRWKPVQIFCQPEPIRTFPSRSINAAATPNICARLSKNALQLFVIQNVGQPDLFGPVIKNVSTSGLSFSVHGPSSKELSEYSPMRYITIPG